MSRIRLLLTARRSVLTALAASLTAGLLLSSVVPSTSQPRSKQASQPGATDAWERSVKDAIASREYEVLASSSGLQAPNRANNFRTYFDGQGARVVDRTTGGEPELVRLGLARWGREGALAAVDAGEVTAEGRRVQIARAGLVEWYQNAEAGLEQGFDVAERPEGEGPLVLEVDLGSGRARQDGDAARIESATGRPLALNGLRAWDAGGRDLACRMVADGRLVRLEVEDAAAVYPLTVDPLLTGLFDTLLDSDESGSFMGICVASAGDVNGDGFADVMVAADRYDAGQVDEGAVFVYHGSFGGIFTGGPGIAAAQLESNQTLSNFGQFVASAGDVNGDGFSDIIIGSTLYDNGDTDEGSAFVFHGSPSGITSGNPATANATIESNQFNAQLGISVAGAGDVNGDGFSDVIVGVYSFDNPEANEGVALIFHGSPSGITSGNPATANATLESNQVDALLGGTVSGAGDVNGDGFADVIVGANLYDNPEVDEGASFVFLGSPSGIASGNPTTANATLESDQAGETAGFSVAGAGDVNGDGFADVIVGSPFYDNVTITDAGAAFIYHGSPGGITSGNPSTADGTMLGNQFGALFGVSVDSAGDVNGDGFADVIAGAPFFDTTFFRALPTPEAPGQSGAAFVFYGTPTGISGSTDSFDSIAFLSQDNAEIGASVASAGDVNGDGYSDVIVGAQQYDSGQVDEGAAFVFHGGARGIDSGSPGTADATIQSGQMDAQLGISVAGAGDVNGDGFSDVIVGAPFYDAGEADEGAAFVFHGSPSGIVPAGNPSTANATLEANQASSFFGVSVAGAGDVNGDGFSDVIVGASLYDNGEFDEGAAFIFHGSPSGITSGNPSTANATLESNQISAILGSIVAGAGDVNGDAFTDVVVGASLYDNGEMSEGGVFVFLGSPSGIPSGGPASANATIETNQADVSTGIAVASAGDVNGDGFADIIVGANQFDNGEFDEGAAFVFHGSPSGITSSTQLSINANATLEGNQASGFFGNSVAAAGDVNLDGFADVIVGASLFDNGEFDEGAAFVFHGSPSGIPSGGPQFANTTLEADQVSAILGDRVAGAGDVNGDGFADVIVGASLFNNDKDDGGAAFVFLGSPSGIPSGGASSASAKLEPNQSGAMMGASVAAAGDVNGDGFADVIVGAPQIDLTGLSNQGAAFVFYGNVSTGRQVLARQIRSGPGMVPVQPWGSSGDPDDFTVFMLATHPEGRGRVRLQLQAVPPGVGFGQPGTLDVFPIAWTDVTATPGGVLLGLTIGGLTSNTEYRWRARVQYAPFSVEQSGTLEPPNPAHGPWRRVAGQAVEADIRTANAPSTADLAVTKMAAPNPVNAGELLTYTLTVTNNGPAAAANVALSDATPPGTTFVSLMAPGTWSCMTPPVGGTGPISCTIASLPVSQLDTFTLVVRVNPDVPIGAMITNMANVSSSSTPDPMPANNDASASSTVATLADLMVTVTDVPDPVNAGETIAYTVTVTNNGPSNAANVTLTEATPANTTFESLTPPLGWNCMTPPVGGTGPVICTIAPLPPNAPAVFTLVVRVGAGVPGGTIITDLASVASSTTDPNGANDNTATTTTVATSADLMVTVTDMPDPVDAGQTITYTVTVTNNGPSDAANVILSEAVPANTTFESLTPPLGWNCMTPPVGGTGPITCTIASLAPGAPATFTLVVRVGAGVPGGTIITDMASVSSTADPNAANDTASTTTTVSATADLSVTVTDAPDPVAAGATITYTVTVTNNGPSVASSVTLTEAVPANTTFESLTPPVGWNCMTPPVGGTGPITCTVPSLAVAAPATFTLVVRVGAGVPAGTRITDMASVATGTTDPNAANNTASTTTNVATSADLGVTVTDAPDPVLAGATITYTITVTNNGPSVASGVTLTDAVPDNTTFESLTAPGGWNCMTPPVGGTGPVTCTIASLAPGAPATFTLVVRVGAGVANGTVVTDTATVASTSADANAANNAASATTTVGTSADLSVALSAPDSVQAGDTIAFEILVSNAGPTAATAVALEELIPANTTFESLTAPGGWTCTTPAVGGTGLVRCTIPTLASGASAAFTLVVRVGAGTADATVIRANATVTSATPDAVPENNNAVASVRVQSPDVTANVGVTLTAGPDPVLTGDQITLVATVVNAGPGPATGVVLSGSVPTGTTFVSITSSQGTATGPALGATGAFGAMLGDLPVGAQATVTIVVRVNPDLPDQTSVNASVQVTSTSTDPDPSDNLDTARVTAVAPRANADLSLAIVDAADPVASTLEVVYTYRVENLGPEASVGTTLDLTTPVGTTLVSAVASQGTVAAPAVGQTGAIRVALGVIPTDAEATLTLVLRVTAEPGAQVRASGTVTAASTDPNLGNNTASEGTAIVAAGPLVDLTVELTETPDPVVTGQPLTYTLVVRNAGAEAAEGVTLVNAIPREARFLSATTTDGTLDVPPVGTFGAVTASIGRLEAGASVTVVVQVSVIASAGEAILTAASVRSRSLDADPGSNQAFETTSVIAAPEVIVDWDPPPVAPGNPAPQNLTVEDMGRGVTEVQVGRQAPPPTGTLLCYNVYRANQPGVQPTAANLFTSVPPGQTQTNAPTAPGGTFFVVTACYTTGESGASNEAGSGGPPPGPVLTGVDARPKKLILLGTGFTATVTIQINGVGFEKASKVKGGTQVTQKGKLLDGRTIKQAFAPGQTVTLSVRNSDGATTTITLMTKGVVGSQ